MIRRTAHVIIPHEATYADPLRVPAGAPLHTGREDDEFPGWVWCTAADGRQGWVPRLFLKGEGANVTADRDYDARELSISAGERLTLLEEVNGWVWVENGRGERGWVPASHLAADTT